MKKILVDLSEFVSVAAVARSQNGVFRVGHELLCRLADRYQERLFFTLIHPRLPWAEAFSAMIRYLQENPRLQQAGFVGPDPARIFRDEAIEAEEPWFEGFDRLLIPLPAVSVPPILRQMANPPRVVHIIHDLMGLTCPELMHPEFIQQVYKQLLSWDREKDYFLCPCEAIKNDLISFQVAAKHISVVPWAADSTLFYPRTGRTQYPLPSSYFLHVGRWEPRKNIDFLVDAFCHFIETSGSDATLVLVGSASKSMPVGKVLFEKLQDPHWQKHFICLDHVTDEELAVLHSHAEGFIFPSLCEGFGIPLLEAMACGAPVLCSRITPLTEIAEKAALYFDPTQINGLVAQIAHLKAGGPTLRKQMIAEGKKRAAAFSWEKSTDLIVQALNSTLQVF